MYNKSVLAWVIKFHNFVYFLVHTQHYYVRLSDTWSLRIRNTVSVRRVWSFALSFLLFYFLCMMKANRIIYFCLKNGSILFKLHFSWSWNFFPPTFEFVPYGRSEMCTLATFSTSNDIEKNKCKEIEGFLKIWIFSSQEYITITIFHLWSNKNNDMNVKIGTDLCLKNVLLVWIWRAQFVTVWS